MKFKFQIKKGNIQFIEEFIEIPDASLEGKPMSEQLAIVTRVCESWKTGFECSWQMVNPKITDIREL